jgi:hypothetical protein
MSRSCSWQPVSVNNEYVAFAACQPLWLVELTKSALVAIAQVPWHFSFEVTDAENYLSPSQATAGRVHKRCRMRAQSYARSFSLVIPALVGVTPASRPDGPRPSLRELLALYTELGFSTAPKEAKLVRYQAGAGGIVNGRFSPNRSASPFWLGRSSRDCHSPA